MTDYRERIYVRYQPVAKSLAKKLSVKFRRPYAELLEEAQHILAVEVCEKWGRFDATKAKEITWVYQKVYWGLMTYCGDGIKRARRESGVFEEEHVVGLSWLETVLLELGTEAGALVNAIFESPGELAGALWSTPTASRPHLPSRVRKAPGRAKKALQAHFQAQGWSRGKFQAAWREVEQSVVGA